MTRLQPIYVTLPDAAAMFGLSRATLYRAADRGDLVIRRGTGRSLLAVAELVTWIEDRAASEKKSGVDWRVGGPRKKPIA